MNDMSSVIIPKSDQINADDLIAGPMTITIRDVHIKGGQEQPVSIYFDGSEKAFRPCKSMSRVLVAAWGADAKVYIGRSLTLYRDPEVKWGGLAVGGIRISHMSDIEGTKTLMLTATKGSRKPHKVQPIVGAPASSKAEDAATKWTNGYLAKIATLTTVAEFDAFVKSKATKLAELETARPELHKQVTEALAKRNADLSAFADDDTPTVADEAVAKMKADLATAPDASAVEAIIKDAAPHMAFLDDDVVISLEIAFDQARKWFEEQVG